MNLFKFYVYAYLRDDGTPYYIGKGHGKRAWNKHSGGITVPANLKDIVLLEHNLSEIGALTIERRMIRWYGRKDLGTGILRNLTDGGDGATGKRGPQKAPRSAEHRSKLAAANRKRMEDPEIRKRISSTLKSRYVDECNARISAELAGAPMLPICRSKLLGKKQSPETIAKRINKNTGKKRTPEQIERLRQGNLGKKRTLEQVERMRQVSLAVNERKRNINVS